MKWGRLKNYGITGWEKKPTHMAEEESSPISRESLLASMTADEMEKMLQLLRRPVTSPASSNASPNGNNNATEVNATSSSVHTSPYRSCNIESNPLVLEREDRLLGPMADGCIRICEYDRSTAATKVKEAHNKMYQRFYQWAVERGVNIGYPVYVSTCCLFLLLFLLITSYYCFLSM